MNKQNLRKHIKHVLKELSHKEIQQKSESIIQYIQDIPDFFNHQTYLLFCPMKYEPNIYPLIDILLEQNKTVLLPKIQDQKLIAVELTPLSVLEDNIYGICEPAESTPFDSNIDIALIPAVAFDTQKNRLGHGGWYYDRFLENHSISQKIGVCFEEQLLDAIPYEPHDQKIDILITEKGCQTIKKQ